MLGSSYWRRFRDDGEPHCTAAGRLPANSPSLASSSHGGIWNCQANGGQSVWIQSNNRQMWLVPKGVWWLPIRRDGAR